MKTEIERKFLVKKLPDLSNIDPIRYERYYLKRDSEIEDRIQKVNGKYFREIKKSLSVLERTKDKKEITEEEFNDLKQNASEVIIRDSYKISNKLSIKIYKGRFEGLIRAEIEFDNEEEARNYQPLDWMGKEITDSSLGRDSRLLDLRDKELNKLISNLSI